MFKKILPLTLTIFILALPLLAADASEMTGDDVILTTDDGEQPGLSAAEKIAVPIDAREDFINRIIELGQQQYRLVGRTAQRAHYSGDIYICKNFTMFLFNQNRNYFRMAAYPDMRLILPNNLPRDDCEPYSYGVAWEEIAPENGNPFYEAASFRYDTSLSADENMALALEFMRQVKRGDFFQMSANYDYGVGAHSAIMIADYDPETDSVHWMDSNMLGERVDGIRYGYVQFDEVCSIAWWAEAFCKYSYGATIYRLRDDIIYAP